MKILTKLLISSMASLFLTYNCFGQDKVNGGSGGFHVGYKQYSVSNYNYFLEDGVADLDDNIITIGGGGYHVINNWMIGAYGFYQGGERRNVTLDQNVPQENLNYSLDGGGGYLTLGYVVFHTENLFVFPQAGIGFEALTLSKNLDRDVVANPEDFLSTNYRWFSPMLDLSAGVDFYPFKGFKLGLRAGYNLTLQKDNNWSHNGGDYINEDLPENDLDGFYVSVVVGGGWLGEK